jgi:hypothetical protein
MNSRMSCILYAVLVALVLGVGSGILHFCNHTRLHSEPQQPRQISCNVKWLFKYENFHASNRNRPGAKYLVHMVEGTSGGLGDRLRGMLFAVRVAAASKRVIIFKWAHPHSITNFFLPAGRIDWQAKGLQLPSGPILRGIDTPIASILDGSFLDMNEQVVIIQVRQ